MFKQSLCVQFQFQPKKAEEARKRKREGESESDWDSLSEDVPEPSSSPDVTPRHQPAPPPDSLKDHVSQKRPQIKSQPAIATPERSSVTNSPATQPRAKPATPSSHTPSQMYMYGKTGITNFVDQSISATTFNDSLQQGSQGRRDDGIHIEMNDVDYHQRDPSFTDFQGMRDKHIICYMYVIYSKIAL